MTEHVQILAGASASERSPSKTRWMQHAASLLMLLVMAAGCATGPSTRVAPPPTPVVTQRGTAEPDAARALIDSVNRLHDVQRPAVSSTGTPSGAASLPAVAPIRLSVDTSRDLAWLDILRDSQLVALVNEAVRNNRDLRAAQGRVQEFRAQLGVARSALLPSVVANGGASRNKAAFGPNVIEFDAVRVTSDLSWELDFWGRIRRQSQAAGYESSASQEDVRATVLSLVGDVATAYLQLRELDESLRIADQTLTSRRSTLELARRRFTQGVTSELDVWQFEAELAEPAARVAEFARQRTQLENRLSQLLGRTPGPIERGHSLADAVQALIVPDSVPGVLIVRRPDVAAAERTLQASLARVGAATAARFPTISVTGQYGTQRPDFSGLFARQGEIYTMQLGVSVPLFTGGRLRNEQRIAEARAEQARSRYEQSVLTGLRESNDALAGVRLSRDQLSAQQTQVRALDRAFALADQRYRSGVSGYLEVLDAQRRLFAAQLAFVQTERQYLVSTVDLYRALGGGWDASARK